MVQSKAAAAGIKVKAAGPKYAPSDVRERRDQIKNFLANSSHVDVCNDKLFKVLVSESQ